MYYVYVLQSIKDGKMYIGYTNNLKRRFIEHNQGLSLATKYKLPYTLVFYEAFTNTKDAKHRETYLKSGWGVRTIKKILKYSL